jgi:arylsulfatase A-like enzyme
VCCELCAADAPCGHFVWEPAIEKGCHLKKGTLAHAGLNNNTGYVAGEAVAPPRPPVPPPPPRPPITSLFLYLAYQAIHSPDEVPDSYKERFRASIPDTADGVGQHRRTVAGMVSALDEGIGNVTRALQAAGMAQQTIIVFTTDNGGPAQGFNSMLLRLLPRRTEPIPEPMSHGNDVWSSADGQHIPTARVCVLSGNMASNWPLRGMKRTLWEGGVRGNGFAWGAGLQKVGYVSRAMLHATDLPVSLLAVAVNGLEREPTSSAWIDWREHPLLAKTMAQKGEPPFQIGDVRRSVAHTASYPRGGSVKEERRRTRWSSDCRVCRRLAAGS